MNKRRIQHKEASARADDIFRQYVSTREARPACKIKIEDEGPIDEVHSPYLDVGVPSHPRARSKRKKWRVPLPTNKDINRLMRKGRKSYEHLRHATRVHLKQKRGATK